MVKSLGRRGGFVKIEDINYVLPTEQIAEKDFDKEKWLQEHPIDYFKYIYLLFNTTKNAPKNIPRTLAMDVAFQALYPVTRLYIPNTLYKYYSLNDNRKLNKQKFNTLQSQQIFMSKIKDFNDPFDGKAFFYDSKKLADIKRLEHVGGKIIDDFTAFHRGTALTENNTSCMPMWAHYANNHQGFCVAYDMKNPANTTLAGCTFPIQYTDERLDITSFMKEYVSMVSAEVDRQSAQGRRQILINDLSLIYVAQFLCNIKHSTWSYEKEFRCTAGAQAKGMPYIDAIPKAIYIGISCSEQNRKKLVEIASTLLIPVYQMRLNELSEKYCLEEVLLKD